MHRKVFALSAIIISTSLFALSPASTMINKHFNNSMCDQILDNNGYFKTCYDYNYKGAKFVAYTLSGTKVNLKNLKKKPRFYEDRNLPNKARIKYSDYTRSGYDRGHLAPDAAFDYSQRSLRYTYAMSNIIPQTPTVNQGSKAWKGLEKFGRTLASKLGKINVLNGVVYGKKPKRIGRNRMAVPSAFWKMYYTNHMDYQRCFYFENTPIIDKSKRIKDYEIDCSQLVQ